LANIETIGIYWLQNDTLVKLKGIKKDKEGLGVTELELPSRGEGGRNERLWRWCQESPSG